ncbi:MAG: histidine kinase [Gammaproteobacteria bacterium]|nr:MAG: histidine kinase [Gammaproteobacteria bacterium]
METIAQLIESKGGQVWSIGPNSNVYSAIEKMAEKNTGALAVVTDEKLVGIISERDYTRKVILDGKSSNTTLVSEIMTSNVITASSGQKISECMAIMDDKGFRHMPVLDGENLVGMLSLRDLVKVILQNNEILIKDLESYINA